MKYFKLSEFNSPGDLNSGSNMNRPFVITRGFSTEAHNESLIARGYPASVDSAHLRGLAADIWAEDSRCRGLILSALREVGFHRLGISAEFIHVDDDPSKPHDCTWLYK
jgi:uncharacterized protein YcbK (DUF882 family)